MVLHKNIDKDDIYDYLKTYEINYHI